MAALKLSLRTGLPLLLAACTFEAGGLGDESRGDGSSTTGTAGTVVDTTTGDLTGSSSSEPTGGSATDSGSSDPTAGTTDATTGTTTDIPASCGDSTIDPGEECDAGPMNGDDKACTSECNLNVCGDGKLGPGEGCDDGNATPDDGCSPECASESCGDGVKQPAEACDDGNDTNDDDCTDACTLPACGDTIVQAGEQCDTGGESAECNVGCTHANCGDGVLNLSAGEVCDDSNNDNTDACAACKPAVCGDGFVQANVESCDDGNKVDNDVCSNACKLNGLRVFVSSAIYNGNLGGLAGADQKCEALAAAANLGGSWMAWLSDGFSSPASRFISKGGPRLYARIDGKLVANNWADLLSKPLLAPIDITEKGQSPGDPSHVWTNTKPDGTTATFDKYCFGWISANSNGRGIWGQRTATDTKWSAENDDKCDAQNRLYCFEQ